MNEHLWWYVARSGGIVALVLATLSVVWGLLISTRMLENKPRQAWLLSVHKLLGAGTVIFTFFHMLGLYLDNFVSFGFADLLIPFASDWNPGPVAWGIVCFYLLAAVQISSMVMHRIPRRLWRLIHMSSFGVMATGLIHGVTAGTDASNPLYVGGSIAATMLVGFLTIYRIVAHRRSGLLAAVGG